MPLLRRLHFDAQLFLKEWPSRNQDSSGILTRQFALRHELFDVLFHARQLSLLRLRLNLTNGKLRHDSQHGKHRRQDARTSPSAVHAVSVVLGVNEILQGNCSRREHENQDLKCQGHVISPCGLLTFTTGAPLVASSAYGGSIEIFLPWK